MSPTGYLCAIVAGLALAYAVEEGRRLAGGRLMRVPATALKLALGEQAELVLASYDVVPDRLRASGFEFEYNDHEAALMDLLGSAA